MTERRASAIRHALPSVQCLAAMAGLLATLRSSVSPSGERSLEDAELFSWAAKFCLYSCLGLSRKRCSARGARCLAGRRLQATTHGL
ncbi:hypothetical protein HaLaN_25653, partial [Haematococcus lacustris]